jgi:hypothetical protein
VSVFGQALIGAARSNVSVNTAALHGGSLQRQDGQARALRRRTRVQL